VTGSIVLLVFEETFRADRNAGGGESPPLQSEIGWQPGLSLGQALERAPAAGPPLGTVIFENPLFVADQPAEEGLGRLPTLLYRSNLPVFASGNRSVWAIP
jgi:hypothetical protein